MKISGCIFKPGSGELDKTGFKLSLFPDLASNVARQGCPL